MTDGWRLDGVAAFSHDGEPCGLRYRVDCDAAWRTRAARVDGWIAGREYVAEIDRADDGRWLLNGAEQAAARGCVDIDLAFTPATNLLPLRRFALEIGAETAALAAYLNVPATRLTRLEQSYRRLDRTRYAYESPASGYAATLEVAEVGFVTSYPGLWEATGMPGGD